MRILVSNDDGVFAPGLAALANALGDVAEIQVVAPDRDRSGASNSLTLDRPLEATELDNGFFSINGTPTDCVHLGMSGLFSAAPDLVVSGINAGANLGDDVLYSGTVAAAVEGRSLHYPAMAVSLVGHHHYETAAMVARDLVQKIQLLNVPRRTVLNINVPDLPLDELKGIHVTRLGHRYLAANPIRSVDPRGKERFWIAAAAEAEDDGPGTDFYAVAEGFVSITPIQIDMTRYSDFDNLGSWLEESLE